MWHTFPIPGDPLNDLQSRYDGRLPHAARAAALAGGPEQVAAVQRDAARRLHKEICDRAWRAVALRRAALAARQVKRDRWLQRLVAGLVEARMRAVTWETDQQAVNTDR